MKASKFTGRSEGVIIWQGEDGMTVDEICRNARISQETYFYCKKMCAGQLPSEMKRLRELEAPGKKGKSCSIHNICAS